MVAAPGVSSSATITSARWKKNPLGWNAISLSLPSALFSSSTALFRLFLRSLPLDDQEDILEDASSREERYTFRSRVPHSLLTRTNTIRRNRISNSRPISNRHNEFFDKIKREEETKRKNGRRRRCVRRLPGPSLCKSR